MNFCLRAAAAPWACLHMTGGSGCQLGTPVADEARASGSLHVCAGCIDFWWYHGLIADEMRDGLKASCNMSTVGPLVETGKYGVPHTSSECDELLDEVGANAYSPAAALTHKGSERLLLAEVSVWRCTFAELAAAPPCRCRCRWGKSTSTTYMCVIHRARCCRCRACLFVCRLSVSICRASVLQRS